MKHHIKMLTDMVSGGENEAALQYLASMGHLWKTAESMSPPGTKRLTVS